LVFIIASLMYVLLKVRFREFCYRDLAREKNEAGSSLKKKKKIFFCELY